MVKLLEKELTDAIKERKRIIGSKQILNSLKDSKLVVLSQSIPKETEEKILKAAKKDKVPTLQLQGSSVELGRLCGVQFRVSAISLTGISETNVKTIIKENKTK